VRRGGWHVAGGVTFYRSAVTLSNSAFLDATAPAAFHAAHTRFVCEESEFGRISAQALRSEYAEGHIQGCRFHDVLGTAISAQGSRLHVRSVSLLRVYDPGVLATQNSVVTVDGGRSEDVAIALASSDGSHIHVEDAVIQQAWRAGLAAYTSGLGVGPASVHAEGIVFESEDAVKSLVQPGSSVRLERVAAATRELDVEGLTWREQTTTTIRPLSYRLGPHIWLVGYALDTDDLAAGEPLQLTLYWRSTAALDGDYTVFVHVRDRAGETLAGADTMPRDNAYPTTAWPAGPVIDDRHLVPLNLPAGEYRVALGMYDLASGQRLSVRDSDGERVADDAILLDLGLRIQ
jgi:hypothetical protein